MGENSKKEAEKLKNVANVKAPLSVNTTAENGEEMKKKKKSSPTSDGVNKATGDAVEKLEAEGKASEMVENSSQKPKPKVGSKKNATKKAVANPLPTPPSTKKTENDAEEEKMDIDQQKNSTCCFNEKCDKA